jgi:hypothetical protein
VDQHGRPYKVGSGGAYSPVSAKAIMPDTADVLHSLVSDSSVIDHPTFESWADEYGFDADSRKAEQSYRDCLAIALALRSAIGEAGLEQLREAFNDY